MGSDLLMCTILFIEHNILYKYTVVNNYLYSESIRTAINKAGSSPEADQA